MCRINVKRVFIFHSSTDEKWNIWDSEILTSWGITYNKLYPPKTREEIKRNKSLEEVVRYFLFLNLATNLCLLYLAVDP